MSTPALPQRPLLRPGYLLVRPPLALATALLGVASIACSERIRTFEASTSVRAMQVFLGRAITAWPGHPVMLAQLGNHQWLSLRIVESCSAAMLLPGVAAITAVLLLVRTVPAASAVAGLIASTAVLAITNLLRIAMIVAATREWGADLGFEVTHTWLGTMVTIGGCAAAVACFLYFLTRGKRRRRPTS